jgi:acid phosphatase family membrane protein YuiD
MNELTGSLIGSFTFISVGIAWFLAQSIKVVIYRFTEGRWSLWHFFEAGGMPSAHSASVTALTLAIGLEVGWFSPLFTACLVFALIVMYDATGVRRAAGKQAELLNKIIDDIYATGKVKIAKLREILGHDPIEVVAGATLAAIVTLITYYVYFAR